MTYETIAAIVISPMLMGFIVLFGTFSLGEEHGVLKTFLFMFALLSFVVSLHFGTLAVIQYYPEFTAFTDLVAKTISWFIMVYILFIFYWLLTLFKVVIEWIGNVRGSKQNYGDEY